MHRLINLLTIITLLLTVSWTQPQVRAASVDDLNAQKKALEEQAKKAHDQALQQKTVAQRAAERIELVKNQIGQLQSNIATTEKNIADTNIQIEQQNQQIALFESDLRRLEDKKGLIVRELYKASVSHPDELTIFSNESVSKREEEQENFKALKKSVATIYAKTKAAKAEVENSRTQLVKKQEELESLKTQQDEQQRGLADYRLAQAELKQDAEAAVVSLEAKEKAAKAQMAKIESQISAALSAIIAARARSGGGITGGQGVGQRVRRGTIVGHVGSTGYSSGPHVHVEVRSGNTPVNPKPFIDNGTIAVPVNDYVVTQGFGYTDYAASGAYGGAIHTGIDMAGPYGQPVYAPADGTVIMNQYYGGYGNAWAEQLDNGLVVLLGHMTGR